MNKQIILGIGTPRSGTKSLYTLFLKQSIFPTINTIMNKNIYIKHEGSFADTPFLCKCDVLSNYDVIVNNYLTMIERNDEKQYFRNDLNRTLSTFPPSHLQETSLFHINISHALVYYLDKLLEKNNNIKIIIIKRNRYNNIKSIYNRYKYDKEVINLDDNKLHKYFFQLYFKNLNDDNYEKKIGEYYDNFYHKIDKIAEKYPDNFIFFETEILFSSEDQQKKMLKFCGFKQCHTANIHEYNNDN